MNSFHRGDWLSLAQSVASMIAIVGAFGVVFLQHHLQRDREAAAERAKFNRVLALAIWTVQKLYDVTVELKGVSEKAFVDNFGDYAMERVRDLRAAISMLPLSELDERRATALISARDATNLLIAVIHVARTKLPPATAEDYLVGQLSNLSKVIGKELDVIKGEPGSDSKA
ncbi:hypothetical protein [Cupriavidus sp. H39]|uniref:hypothetical protein n=1 Tax=Cupriavidus sp. H39 TaxID=3401635 RepID=UPI003CFC6856